MYQWLILWILKWIFNLFESSRPRGNYNIYCITLPSDLTHIHSAVPWKRKPAKIFAKSWQSRIQGCANSATTRLNFCVYIRKLLQITIFDWRGIGSWTLHRQQLNLRGGKVGSYERVRAEKARRRSCISSQIDRKHISNSLLLVLNGRRNKLIRKLP